MTSLSHWFTRKVKEYQFKRKAVLDNDLVRKSFSGETGAHIMSPSTHQGKLLPAFLSLSLILVLPFFIWGTGSSKVTPVTEIAHPIEKEADLSKTAPLNLEEPSNPHVKNMERTMTLATTALEESPVKKQKISPVPEEKWDVIQDRKVFRKRPVRNTVLVDKANRKLYVAQRQKDSYKIIKEFSVSVGEIQGNKVEQGDKRTPEGIYNIIDIKFDRELLPMYGPMAFVLSYPNDRDRLLGKTGSGIWLHGTGVKDLTPDTKGCVELTDEGIMELSSYLAYNTPIFIFPERRPLTQEVNRIPIFLVNGLEMEYTKELPLLKARLEGKRKG